MHGSTSPSKKALPSHSCGPLPLHVTRSRTRPTTRQAWSIAGSRPRSRSNMRTCIVESHPRFHATPPHRPSSAWRASSRAPRPSVATRARSPATSLAGAPVRSLITCHRIDGSESSSQSMTVTELPPAFGRIVLSALCSHLIRGWRCRDSRCWRIAGHSAAAHLRYVVFTRGLGGAVPQHPHKASQ
jgi:hypothetical protein